MTAADHANTVREALEAELNGGRMDSVGIALQALDALQHQAETAENRETLLNQLSRDFNSQVIVLSQAKAERDAAIQAAEQAQAALQKIQQASTLRNARELAEWELARAALGNNT